MIDVGKKKEEIINFLKENGPSIPVKIAKKIEMESVFASAILSEMLQEKRVKTSSLKIGSSPLYLLPGQEEMLEKFSEYLKDAEKEAFLKIKSRKILEDEKEEPRIRIALRNLRDFAIPFKKNEKIFWKYAFEKEEKRLIQKAKGALKEQKNPEKKEKPEIQEITIGADEFFEKTKNFLERKGLKIISKIQSDKKEIVLKALANLEIGEIEFLVFSKNKKTLTKDEVDSILQRAQYEKAPAIILIRKEPAKSIRSFEEENKNFLKILVL